MGQGSRANSTAGNLGTLCNLATSAHWLAMRLGILFSMHIEAMFLWLAMRLGILFPMDIEAMFLWNP
jgi:hypothetical protein